MADDEVARTPPKLVLQSLLECASLSRIDCLIYPSRCYASAV